MDVIQFDISGAVATITLNRPDVHNAFEEAMILRLSALFEELKYNDDVDVVILKGAGKSFSAGADINWMQRASAFTVEENYADAHKLAQMLFRLYSLPKVTIACVHGAAMGGGLGLVACCDIVLGTVDATFALSEVRLGLVPATIGPYVLSAIGERQMRRYAQTGEKFNGETAMALGLVHEIVPDDAALSVRLSELVATLSANGPQAMKAAKRLCLDYADAPIDDSVIPDTACLIARIRTGGEAREGLSAFLEKRKPVWTKA